VVARFRSLSEKAVDEDGNGTLDHLEIAAELDVVEPGKYEMRLSLNGPESQGLQARGEQMLGMGAQTMIVSIPAERLRVYLKDGPWKIGGVQIFRPEGNSFGDFVATDGLTLTTAAYKRAQWDPGASWGDDVVTARGIDPGPEGKFRLVEVQWKVFTPGGRCDWFASLGMDRYESDSVFVEANWPAGAKTISFVFDGKLIAGAPRNEWFLSTIVGCAFPFRDDVGLRHLVIDPKDFEQNHASFRLRVQKLVSVTPGESWRARVEVANKKVPDVNIRAAGSVPGISITPLANGQLLDVHVAQDVKPGRYFVPLVATSGSETATTELVVDVVP
jgi:hypothetical protein